MLLKVEKEIIAMQNTYSAFDENNNLKYKIKSEFFSRVPMFRVYDNMNTEIAIMKKKFMAILPEYHIEIDKKEIGFIKAKATFLRAKYNISDLYTAVADNMNCKYDISDKQNDSIATIERIQPAMESSFTINMLKEVNELLLVLFVVVVEELRIRENMRRRNNIRKKQNRRK